MTALSDIPIGLQLWSLNEACSNDLPGTLKAVRQMGYDGVEFAGFHGLPATELKALCSDLGLHIAGSHTGLPLLEDDKFEATVEYNQALGNDKLIVPAIPGNRLDGSLEGWRRVVAHLRSIQNRLRPLGLKTGFHNHDREFGEIDGGTPFDTIFSSTDDDFIMQVDIGWVFHAGKDVRDYLRKYPGRSETVHAKAWSASNETACIGEDDIPWRDVLQCAVDVGQTKWFIVEHERHAGDPVANVRTCLDHLRSL